MSKLDRKYSIQQVRLGAMYVSDLAQRKRNDGRVDYLFAHFDLDRVGYPVVNKRDERYYIIDGQHRVEALKRWLGKDWERCEIPCMVYSNLNVQDEAEMFLRLNDVLNVRSFDKFKTAVAAGRDTETKIYKTVEKEGMHISESGAPGTIKSVSSLRKVYTRSTEQVLGRTIRVIRDAYGDAGFEAKVIDGIGHFCHRYNGVLNEAMAIEKLGDVRGGVKGLLNRAEQLRLRTGSSTAVCVAAAAVDIYNSGKGGGKKLPSWWKTDEPAGAQ